MRSEDLQRLLEVRPRLSSARRWRFLAVIALLCLSWIGGALSRDLLRPAPPTRPLAELTVLTAQQLGTDPMTLWHEVQRHVGSSYPHASIDDYVAGVEFLGAAAAGAHKTGTASVD